MFAFSSPAWTTMSKEEDHEFTTVTKIDKGVKALTELEGSFQSEEDSSDYEKFVAIIRTLGVSGYVIAKNEVDGDILESSPGVTAGGYIIVTKQYVAIAYSSKPSLTVYKAKETTMNISFRKLTPLEYLASEAAVALGYCSNSYCITSDGIFETFDSTKEPMNLPNFSRAALQDGVPVALFGVRTGTASIDFVPTSNVGGRVSLLTGAGVIPKATQYPDDEGIYLSPSIKSRISSFVSSWQKGARVSYDDFCRKYKCPKSSAYSKSGALGLLNVMSEELFSSCTTVVFWQTPDICGSGIREFINANCEDWTYPNGIVVYDSKVNSILNDYYAYLELLAKQAFFELTADNYQQLRIISQKLATYRLTMQRPFPRDRIFPAECFVGDDQTEVMIGLADFKLFDVPTCDPQKPSASEDSDKLREKFWANTHALLTYQKGCSLKEQTIEAGDETTQVTTVEVSQERLETMYAEYLEHILDSVKSTTGHIIDAIQSGVGNVTFSIADTSYSWRSYCKSRECRMELFSKKFNASDIASVIGLGHLWGYSADGNVTNNVKNAGRKLNHYNKLDSIKICNPVRKGNSIECDMSFILCLRPLPFHEAGTEPVTIANSLKNWLRDTLKQVDGTNSCNVVFSGMRYEPAEDHYLADHRRYEFHILHCQGIASNYMLPGVYSSMPMCEREYGNWKRIDHEYHYWAECPTFEYSVVMKGVELPYMEFDYADLVESSKWEASITDSISHLESVIQEQGAKKLVNDLAAAGLLHDIRFVAATDGGSTYLKFGDAARITTFKCDTLGVLLQALVQVRESKRPDDVTFALSEGDRAEITTIIEQLKNDMQQCGYTFLTDSDLSSYEDVLELADGSKVAYTGEGKPFWYCTASAFAPQDIGVDVNLIGLYCEF